MSTRAVVNFYDTYGKKKVLRAKVYRHSDGYPDGLGNDLKEFLQYVNTHLKDTRFQDASYLASKWVVWDAIAYRDLMNRADKYWPLVKDPSPLDFLGVGIVLKDPSDIEYIYDVVCDTPIPTVTHKHA